MIILRIAIKLAADEKSEFVDVRSNGFEGHRFASYRDLVIGIYFNNVLYVTASYALHLCIFNTWIACGIFWSAIEGFNLICFNSNAYSSFHLAFW